MVDDIEPKVGKPGWAETFFQRKGWKNGWIYSQVFGGKARAGAYFSVYNEWVKDFLKTHDLNVETEFVEEGGDWERVKKLLQKGFPVVIGTKILPSGHFITLIDYNSLTDEFTVLDSWGDANTGYKNQQSLKNIYTMDFLKKNAPDSKGKKGFCRYLALIQKEI